MHQQMTSLQQLWRIVKPGGVYFCEDLQTSYMDFYGGGNAAVQTGGLTMMAFIGQMIEDMTAAPRRQNFEGAEEVIHVDCSREVCAFFKNQ